MVHFQQTKTIGLAKLLPSWNSEKVTIYALGEYRDDGRWSGVGENAREVFEDVVLSLTQVIGKVEVSLFVIVILWKHDRIFTGEISKQGFWFKRKRRGNLL